MEGRGCRKAGRGAMHYSSRNSTTLCFRAVHVLFCNILCFIPKPNQTATECHTSNYMPKPNGFSRRMSHNQTPKPLKPNVTKPDQPSAIPIQPQQPQSPATGLQQPNNNSTTKIKDNLNTIETNKTEPTQCNPNTTKTGDKQFPIINTILRSSRHISKSSFTFCGVFPCLNGLARF